MLTSRYKIAFQICVVEIHDATEAFFQHSQILVLSKELVPFELAGNIEFDHIYDKTV